MPAADADGFFNALVATDIDEGTLRRISDGALDADGWTLRCGLSLEGSYDPPRSIDVSLSVSFTFPVEDLALIVRQLSAQL